MKQAKTYSEQEGHGSVTTLLSERDLLDVCSNAKYSVVHFFHPDFRRCTIMDERLKVRISLRQNQLKITMASTNKKF